MPVEPAEEFGAKRISFFDEDQLHPPESAHSAPDKETSRNDAEDMYATGGHGKANTLQLAEEESPVRSLTLTVEEVRDAGVNLVHQQTNYKSVTHNTEGDEDDGVILKASTGSIEK